jgi:hypothetical protein
MDFFNEMMDPIRKYLDNSNVKMFSEFIKKEINVDEFKDIWNKIEDENKPRAIRDLVRENKLEYVKYVFSIDKQYFDSETTNTALHNFKILNWLCENGVPFDKKAAQYAIRHNNMDVFKSAIKFSDLNPEITKTIGEHYIQGPGNSGKFPFTYNFFIISNLNNVPWHPYTLERLCCNLFICFDNGFNPYSKNSFDFTNTFNKSIPEWKKQLTTTTFWSSEYTPKYCMYKAFRYAYESGCPIPYPNTKGYWKHTIYVPLVYELCKYIDEQNKAALVAVEEEISKHSYYDSNMLSIIGEYMSIPNKNSVKNHPEVTPLRT